MCVLLYNLITYSTYCCTLHLVACHSQRILLQYHSAHRRNVSACLKPSQSLAHMIHSLPNVMLSRFIINFRQVGATLASSALATSTGEYSSRFTAPNFHRASIASVLDNLGEPLVFGADEVEGCTHSSDLSEHPEYAGVASVQHLEQRLHEETTSH